MDIPPSDHTPITINTDETEFIISQYASDTAAWQWCREGVQNALEAGATIVYLDVHYPLLKAAGWLCRTIADNGCGMNPEDLVLCYGAFAQGLKVRGAHANFGQGSKVSLYPWNPAGVVVISRTEENRRGAMIVVEAAGLRKWTWYDPETETEEEAEIRDWIYPDLAASFGYLDVDWTESFPRADHDSGKRITGDVGTVLILLGSNDNHDTLYGDPSRNEPAHQRGVVKYLSTRYLDLPDDVEVWVCHDEKDSNKRFPKPDGTLFHPHRRLVMPVMKYVDQIHEGTRADHGVLVNVDGLGTDIEWWLIPEGLANKGDHSYRPTSHISVEYHEGDRPPEAYEITSDMRWFSRFGIQSRDVARRTFITIRPRVFREDGTWGVATNPSRSRLIAKGGKATELELPMTDWAAAFKAKRPDAIRLACAQKEPDTIDLSGQESFRRQLTEKFKSKFSAPIVIARLKGTIRGEKTDAAMPARIPTGGQPGTSSPGLGFGQGGSGPGTGPGTPSVVAETDPDGDLPTTAQVAELHPTPQGAHRGAQVKRPNSVPQVKPVRQDQFMCDDPDVWVYWDPDETSGFLNINHPQIEKLLDAYTDEEDDDDLKQNIRLCVLETYCLHLGTVILHASDVSKDQKMTVQESMDKYLSPAALSVGSLGWWGLDARVKERLKNMRAHGVKYAAPNDPTVATTQVDNQVA